MPRPCAVETHARSYRICHKGFADATALRRREITSRGELKPNYQKHKSAPQQQLFVAASVKLHGASPWHLGDVLRLFCSRERESSTAQGRGIHTSTNFVGSF